MDLLVTNPTYGRGSQAHRLNRTLSGINDSGRDSGLAPESIKPNKPAQNKKIATYVKSKKTNTLRKLYSPLYLDHAVTVGIRDVRLQTRKQGSVVMFEVKVLQSKL